MNVAVLYQSLRGGTERAAEAIVAEFAAQGAAAGAYPVSKFDAQFVLKADLLVIGTWTDGLFGLAARPAQMGKLRGLPTIAHKPTAVFVTYEISPKASLAKLVDWAERQEAHVVGSIGLHRKRPTEGLEDFVKASLAALSTTAT
jgi:flavodoxin